MKLKKFVHKANVSGLDFRKIQGDGPGELMLLQTQDWINAPDGSTYKDIWGRTRVIQMKEVLGFDPRGHVTNFVYQVGEGPNTVFVMGCRVLYAHICHARPTNKNCYIVEDKPSA